MDDRTYATDKCILLDQRYAFLDLLPPDGTDKNDEQIRIRNYERIHAYWALSACNTFGFSDLSVMDSGSYAGPDELILNPKYISFLLRRIPKELLRFGMTGANNKPVRLYRGKDPIGLLMPVVTPPSITDRAESGDSKAQYLLGFLQILGGSAVTPRVMQGLNLLSKAALQDCPDSLCLLGSFYFSGKFLPQDSVRALVLFERAIDLGSKDAIRRRTRLINSMTPRQYRSATAQIVSPMFEQDARATKSECKTTTARPPDSKADKE